MVSRLIEAADAGCVVLAPSLELAAALSDAVERAHRDSGREIWPTPRMLDLGTWLREQHLKRQLADSSLPRCLSDAEERELWRRVVLESDASEQFLEPSGAARAARRARRTLLEHAIAPSELRAYPTEESRALLSWMERYEARCRELGAIGPDELLGALRSAESGGDSAAPAPSLAPGLAWIDSPLWRPVARRWLERGAGAPLLAQTSSLARRAPRTVRAVSPDAELAEIGEWARAGLEADPAFRAWISIRDLAARREEVADALDAALAPRRFCLEEPGDAAYAMAGGPPLGDHGPVRAALELLTAAHGVLPFERFSALLRAPELQATPGEASAAARLDTLLRTRAPSEASLRHWLTLAGDIARTQAPEPPAALTRLAQAARALEELDGHHRMSRWLSVWVRAFEQGPWALRHRWSSAEYQAAKRFRELLETLARGEGTFASLSRRAAEGILERATRDTAFQVETGIPPVWVSAQLSDPWLAYDGIWVTGCEETRWPPPVDPVPLIPPALQRKHGVIAASAESQLEFATELQRRWLERSRACVFSCAEPGEGRTVPPSPLLAELATLPEPSVARSQPHWRAQRCEAPVLEELLDVHAPPVAAGERTRGVATLRAQSRCPFRGFAETRLAADALERPVPGFNERERGQILHEALQGIFEEVRDSRALQALLARPGASAALVSATVRRAVRKQCQRRDPGGRWAEREHDRLQDLLERWLVLEAQRAPFEVERIEGGGETTRRAGLEYTVRIDRIDRLEDGSRVLIDYKTGWAGADWRGERPDNPQLPLYALLHREALVAVAYGRVNAADCRFVAESSRDGIFPRSKATRLEGMRSFAHLVEAWEARIEALALEFARGSAEVAPIEGACRNCRLAGLCRVPSTLDALEAREAGAPAS